MNIFKKLFRKNYDNVFLKESLLAVGATLHELRPVYEVTIIYIPRSFNGERQIDINYHSDQYKPDRTAVVVIDSVARKITLLEVPTDEAEKALDTPNGMSPGQSLAKYLDSMMKKRLNIVGNTGPEIFTPKSNDTGPNESAPTYTDQ